METMSVKHSIFREIKEDNRLILSSEGESVSPAELEVA